LLQTPELITQETPIGDSLDKKHAFEDRIGSTLKKDCQLLQSETVADENEEDQEMGPNKMNQFFY